MGDPDREDRASAPTVARRGNAPTDRPTAVDRPGGARPSAPTDPDPEPPREQADPAASAFDPPADRFAERDELGRGGMGRVVEAHDRALDRPVAVKYMLSSDDAALARFEREARITARLEHPGIVAVHDAGRTADGTPYYVMRRVDGEPLAEVVARRSASERRTLVPNVLAAADAIAYAHARKVIHRDLKPSNILLGPFGETLVIDWGIARVIDDADDRAPIPASDPALTRVGTVAGTPGFMAPEQARGEAIDERVDVYALGTTLFYVLAGELPYTASGATEMIDLAGAGRAPEWGRLPADTPPELRAIIAKAMASRREERYRDAGALAADLRRYVTGQLVGAHQYSRMEQLRRFARKHRATLAVALVAIAVLATGAVISVRRIVRERDAAEAATALADQQRREAMDGRDLLLVQHAEQLAAVDPVAAIAALRRLPVDSHQWRRAAFVAASAASRGIPRGLALESTPAAMIELAPGSRRGAHISFNRGKLVLFELPSLEAAALAVPPSITHGKWLDDRFLLLYGTTPALALVDAERRSVRPVPNAELIDGVAADGRGGAWVLARGGAVLALDAHGVLGPAIARDVTSLVAGSEPGTALVVRAGRLELWRLDERFPLTGADGGAIMGDGRVAARVGDQICAWEVTGIPRADPCWGLDGAWGLVAISHERLLVTHGIRVEAIQRDGRRYPLAERPRSFFRLRSGLVLTGEQELAVHDRLGHVRIPSRGGSYTRIVQSADERWLVALTTNGELLCWDLAGMRPRRMRTQRGAALVGSSGDQIYLERASELYVYDVATATQREIAGIVMFGATPEPSGTWLIALDLAHRNVLVHLPTNTTIVGDPEESFGTFEGRAFSHRGAELSWIAPDGRRSPFARIPGATRVSVGRHHALGVIEDQLCRVRFGEDALACTSDEHVPRLSQAAITEDGTSYLLAGQRLFRWTGVGPLIEVWPGLAFQYLTVAGDDPIAVGPDVMIRPARAAARPISIPTVSYLAAGPAGRLIGTTPTGKVLVIDGETGAWYPLQTDAVFGSRGALVRDNSVLVGTPAGVQLFELAVPTTPAALRAWLASVTNALPVEDSAVVSWPRAPRVAAP